MNNSKILVVDDNISTSIPGTFEMNDSAVIIKTFVERLCIDELYIIQYAILKVNVPLQSFDVLHTGINSNFSVIKLKNHFSIFVFNWFECAFIIKILFYQSAKVMKIFDGIR